MNVHATSTTRKSCSPKERFCLHLPGRPHTSDERVGSVPLNISTIVLKPRHSLDARLAGPLNQKFPSFKTDLDQYGQLISGLWFDCRCLFACQITARKFANSHRCCGGSRKQSIIELYGPPPLPTWLPVRAHAKRRYSDHCDNALSIENLISYYSRKIFNRGRTIR